MTSVLLHSGGLDSSAIAAWKRPDICLFINYGQRAATAEQRAATMVCHSLGLTHAELAIDCSALGRGSMAGKAASTASTWEEFWPFRNQMLLTFAAAWALEHGHSEVWTGSIRSDDRHVDGTLEFYQAAATLTGMQEGGIAVSAPAIGLLCHELLDVSGIDDVSLSWTFSCHTGAAACNRCAGCEKRAGALAQGVRLQPGSAR